MACLPVVLKAAVKVTAAQGKNGVCAPDRPEHPGSFETGTDHGLAAGLDDARADKQVLSAELGISHPFRIPLEVIRLGANLLGHFAIGGVDRSKRAHQLLDFAFVEQSL